MLSIRAVLPDEDLWANEYVQLVFDGEPTAGMTQLKSLSAAQRRACAGVHMTLSPSPASSFPSVVNSFARP